MNYFYEPSEFCLCSLAYMLISILASGHVLIVFATDLARDVIIWSIS